MNYLAHIYLSGTDEKTLVGNFIGDYIKGNKYTSYPKEIQKGILLHRQIDTFTDAHQNFRNAKKLLRNIYGLYSGIIIDLFYDHFLAINWHYFSDESLHSFAKKAHSILLSHYLYLPGRVQGFLPFLIQNRRLESYATTTGIQKSLETMSRYTSLPENSEIAVKIMKANFDFFEANFLSFMCDMVDFVQNEFQVNFEKCYVLPDV